MAYKVCGFSPKKAAELGLKVDDLIILEWLVELFEDEKTEVIHDGDKKLYLTNYQMLLDDMPLLRIKKDTLYRKMKHMNEIGILKHKCVKDDFGTSSYYGLGERFKELI